MLNNPDIKVRITLKIISLKDLQEKHVDNRVGCVLRTKMANKALGWLEYILAAYEHGSILAVYYVTASAVIKP